MLEEKNTKPIEKEDNTVDVSIPQIEKKRIRFDGDNNRVVYLNTSDFTVIGRLEEVMPKLRKLAVDAADELDKGTSEKEVLEKIDNQMRDLIDYVFDEGASEAASPKGSMFDLFNGEFRFEHVIDVLTKLYENNMNEEYKRLKLRIDKFTNKYTKSKGKKK